MIDHIKIIFTFKKRGKKEIKYFGRIFSFGRWLDRNLAYIFLEESSMFEKFTLNISNLLQSLS